MVVVFFFSSRRRHTRLQGDWSSDVCSSDLSRPSSTASACTSRPCPAHSPRKSPDRKSTRLNSSHLVISYAVFCLKKKKLLRRTSNPQPIDLTSHALPSC